MGQLTAPLVPDGAVGNFYRCLHALHAAAGQPSMRDLQRRTRTAKYPQGINPTTIHAAFARPRLARWEVVREIVRVLGGDVEQFAVIWRAAYRYQAIGGTPEPVVRAGVVPAQFTVPRELPPDVFPFVGRARHRADLDDLLAKGERAMAMVVAVITGPAGVGKTALAVHWAHRVADRFPDGQVYVDMRGHEPDEPQRPVDALAGLLRSLGADHAERPAGLAERVARYRTVTADRRMLVVIDNAHSAEQVRPLLPGSRRCMTVVTGRDSLSGLVARDGARRIDLDPMPSDEALTLLRLLIGPRVDREPDAARALTRRCAGWPLALRLAAERAVARPAASFTTAAVAG